MYTSIEELVNAINTQTTYKVKRTSAYKDGIIRDAIEVKGEDTWLNPIIYNPEFMLEYDITEVVDYLNKCYKGKGIDREEIVKIFDNKHLFLDKVYSEVVNTQRWNGQIAERNLEHYESLDLTELYHISYGEGISTKVTRDMLVRLDISWPELVQASSANNWGELRIRTMREILTEANPELAEVLPEDDKLNVITSKDGLWGARYILDTHALDYTCMKLGYDKIIILPSSRHELIVIEYNKDADIDELYSMVSEVNRTQVSEEDFLSSNVYVYEKGSDELNYLK